MPTRSERRSCQALFLCLYVLASSRAVANGRFPRAQRLIENPHDPNQLNLAATYGILTTRDRGRNWFYVCEAAFAQAEAYTGDPLLDLTGDGTFLAGVQSTLNLSRDGGCRWTATLGEGDTTYVIDYTVVKSQPAMVLAVLAVFENGTVVHSLVRSTDNAATWSKVGDPLPVGIVYTVDVDPVDPNTIYVTGIESNVGQLLKSVDGGVTFTTYVIPHTSISEPPYLAAIHPADPRKIFVRTDAWVSIDGGLTADDALLYSSDGGATWTEVFRNRAKMFGFALSPDGATVLVGFGDPMDQATLSVTGPLGVFKSAVGVFSFEHIFSGRVGCLAWTKTGVYICASQHFDGFEVAFSPTADFSLDGGCLTPLLRLDEVKGPLACPAGAPSVACEVAWQNACATFGRCGDAGPARPGCANGDGTDGSSGDGATAGGLADGGGGAPSDGAGGAVGGSGSTVNGNGSAACGCRSAGGPARFGASGIAAVSLMSLCRRRRKLRVEAR